MRRGKRWRVAVVDDAAPVRALVADMLEADGHHVDAYDSGESLLAALDGDAPLPATVVCDVSMPGLSGPDTALALARRHGGLTVLYVSGLAWDAAQLERPGVRSAFLAKPFSREALRAALAALVAPQPPASPAAPIRYTVDAGNRIVRVTSPWRERDPDGRAFSPTPDAVIGQPLWTYITGDDTRHVYEQLLAGVRARQRSAAVVIRCDTPSARREFEITLTPEAHDDVEFHIRPVREEARRFQALFDPTVSRASEVVMVCSWCKRVEARDGWHEVEVTVESLDLASRDLLPALSHGACPDCLDALQVQLAGDA